MQVELISRVELRVHVDYLSDDQFKYIRNYATIISPFIDPDELIRLLTPPTKFKDYRMIYWGFLVTIATVLVGSGLFVYFHNTADS